MYCPKCGEKYRWNVLACPDCGLDLVESRPGEPGNPDIELVTILETGDPGLIAVAKSVLEAEGIEYMVKGEGVQDLFGWGRAFTGVSYVTGPAAFAVRAEDAARAKAVLEPLGRGPLVAPADVPPRTEDS